MMHIRNERCMFQVRHTKKTRLLSRQFTPVLSLSHEEKSVANLLVQGWAHAMEPSS